VWVDFIIIRSAEHTSAVYERKPWERKKRDKVRDRRRQWRQATEREREGESERERSRPAVEAPAPRINPQQSTFPTLPDETAKTPNSEQQRPIASSSGAE